MKCRFASTRRWAASLGVAACSLVVTAQGAPEFEVTSIKRNLADAVRGDSRRLPDGTFIASNISIRNLLAQAWPSGDLETRNLPDWAVRDRYDVTVKPPSGASPAQIQEMWRTLFERRFKLEAHYEPRETPIYELVVARRDGRLGPQLTPSRHDCAALATAAATEPQPPPRTSPPSEEEAMASCGSRFVPGRFVLGGTSLRQLASALSSSVGRIVEDRTGLDGYYALTLTFAPTPPAGGAPPEPGDAPSIFTALEEQLGLKLEPARRLLQTLVIDRIEPPTAN
jgi:uncharacterized protein (TIGR03435 family)